MIFTKKDFFELQAKKNEYAFNHLPNWKSKEECMELVKTKFTKHWEELVKLCDTDKIYYDLFLNDTISTKLL